MIYDLIFFGFGQNLDETGSVLRKFASSLNMAKNDWRILFIRLHSLSLFTVDAKIILAHLETTSFKIKSL